MEIQIGQLPQALAETDVAIAKTGTVEKVTMECAFMRVPTVTWLYKGSWLNYQIAKRVITVKIVHDGEPASRARRYTRNFCNTILRRKTWREPRWKFLQDEARRAKMRGQLDKIIASLGEPAIRN